tara:strand:+ start:4884 stop:5693 length:810 start_codon:yes stop_codon:yes gene_type:complete
MPNIPIVSVVIPCYNMGAFLQETVESVNLTPNKNDYEIIIVNDGSTEVKTIELLKKLEGKGFKVINQKNKGLANARNSGIKSARGKYIIPLDADNKIRPDFIPISIATFKKTGKVDIIYSDAEYFGEKLGIWKVGEFDFSKLLQSNYIDACACYKKMVWEKLSGYDENMRLGSEDWDFWLRAYLKGFKFVYIEKVLFDYRVRKDSMVVNTRKRGTEIVEYMFSKPELFHLKEIRNHLNRLKNNQIKITEPTFEELVKLLIIKIKRKLIN